MLLGQDVHACALKPYEDMHTAEKFTHSFTKTNTVHTDVWYQWMGRGWGFGKTTHSTQALRNTDTHAYVLIE